MTPRPVSTGWEERRGSSLQDVPLSPKIPEAPFPRKTPVAYSETCPYGRACVSQSTSFPSEEQESSGTASREERPKKPAE